MQLVIAFIYFTVLQLCFIASLVVYSRQKQPLYLKLLPLLLLSTIIVESIGYILVEIQGNNSHFHYNIFFPLEISYFLYVAYNLLEGKWLKKTIPFVIVFYVLFVIGYFYTHSVSGFPAYIYSAGSLLIIIYFVPCIFQFRKFPITKTMKREPGFWIAIGMLFYHIGSLPLWISHHISYSFSNGTLVVLNFMLLILNNFMYVCFAMAFLCKTVFKEKNIPEINWSDFAGYSPNKNRSFI